MFCKRVCTDFTDTYRVAVSVLALLTCLIDSEPSFAQELGSAASAAPENSTLQYTSQKNRADRVHLEEVLVTGSRIPAIDEGPQDVKFYTQNQIAESGSTTVTEFLNTLPDVSLSISENGFQTLAGTTTVQLHGLPIGTTLVLINGRRVETSGVGQAYGLSYFDLNTIPLATIDRIELVSEGSSAVYGSDAIAGILNFILKKDFDGFAANGTYGFASGTEDVGLDLAWGHTWDRSQLTVIGSYLNRTELPGYDRALTNDSDYTQYGGPNVDLYMCPDQANIYSLNTGNLPGLGAPYAGVPSGYTGVPSQQEFLGTAGKLNRCSYLRYDSRIMATERASVLIEGEYDLAPAVALYGNVLYSHITQYGYNSPPLLYGQPGYQQFSVGANNPFNPFGEAVGVTEMLSTLGREAQDLGTNYLNAVLGLRGRISQSWSWDIGVSDSEDRSHYTQPDLNSVAVQAAFNSPDSGTALNPFIAAPPGSLSQLQTFLTQDHIDSLGRATVVDAVARGTALTLPGGPLQLVVGGEYEKDTLFQDLVIFSVPNQQTTFHRESHAVFAEGRIPILGPPSDGSSGERVAITVAGRLDHDNQFGDQWSPQFGVEFRPVPGLLFRGSYSRAFRAPDLVDLYRENLTFPGQLTDPLRGNATEAVTITTGGNPTLQPITGLTRAFGVVYVVAHPDVRVSITNWNIEESNAIQNLPAQVIVNNESLFPGAVTRASSCQGPPPCPITTVSETYENFGNLNVAGLDYQLIYRQPTGLGTWIPAAAITQTYRYETSLTPASAAVSAVGAAQDSGNWAPRWKGTISLQWLKGDWNTYLDGRYVSRYQDYHSTTRIGNFWLADASVRFGMGHALATDSSWLQGLYIRLGGVNLFNRLPQFSNYLFGSTGYDPTQGDIRGRYLYAQAGLRF